MTKLKQLSSEDTGGVATRTFVALISVLSKSDLAKRICEVIAELFEPEMGGQKSNDRSEIFAALAKGDGPIREEGSFIMTRIDLHVERSCGSGKHSRDDVAITISLLDKSGLLKKLGKDELLDWLLNQLALAWKSAHAMRRTAGLPEKIVAWHDGHIDLAWSIESDGSVSRTSLPRDFSEKSCVAKPKVGAKRHNYPEKLDAPRVERLADDRIRLTWPALDRVKVFEIHWFDKELGWRMLDAYFDDQLKGGPDGLLSFEDTLSAGGPSRYRILAEFESGQTSVSEEVVVSPAKN